MEDLTRDSSLYDDYLEQTVINEQSEGSKLNPIGVANISLYLHWKMRGSEGQLLRADDYYIRQCDFNTFTELLEADNKEFADMADIDYHTARKSTTTINRKFFPKIKTWTPITLPDGTTKQGLKEWNLSESEEFIQFLRFIHACETNQSITVSLNGDSRIEVEVEDETVELLVYEDENDEIDNRHRASFKQACYHPKRDEGTHPSDKDIELSQMQALIEYANFYSRKGEDNQNWAQAKIGHPKQDTNSVVFPALYNGRKISEFRYVLPDENKRLNEFTQHFGYSDPLLLEDEPIYIKPSVMAESGDFTRILWDVKIERPTKTSSSIFDKIKDLV